MRKSIVATGFYFTIFLLITACGKEEAEPTLEGVYDITYYSIINCGEEESFTIDKEASPCQNISGNEVCLNGTITFTADIFGIDLQLTVDGEKDGEKVEHPYTLEGDQLSICPTPTTCDIATISLKNGILEIVSTNEDDCDGIIRGKKR